MFEGVPLQVPVLDVEYGRSLTLADPATRYSERARQTPMEGEHGHRIAN